jgi:hypothetical protein
MERIVEFYGVSHNCINSSSIGRNTNAIVGIYLGFPYTKPIALIVRSTTTPLSAGHVDSGSVQPVGHPHAASSNVLWATNSSITTPAHLSSVTYAVFPWEAWRLRAYTVTGRATSTSVKLATPSSLRSTRSPITAIRKWRDRRNMGYTTIMTGLTPCGGRELAGDYLWGLLRIWR